MRLYKPEDTDVEVLAPHEVVKENIDSKTLQSKYATFEAGWKYFEQKIIDFCPGFVIDADNFEVCQKLVAYFGGYKEKCQEFGLNPKKGLFLMGAKGCGKSTLMDFFQRNTIAPYQYVYSRYLSMELLRTGVDPKAAAAIIDRYTVQSFVAKKGFKNGHEFIIYDQSQPIDICLDDAGAEDVFGSYHNKFSLIEAIITFRYELLHTGMRTHLTTNLASRSEKGPSLEGLYGDRLTSRLRKMINQIWFPKDAKDRR